ncbi:S8/S53 family peptidase [Nocardioides sp. 1609]|uniref:S8 family peptidase n=1 Tax=Nocardioides sp. 1609 TaxID=2508327 RepID=UPI00106F0AD3|nr:S8/S53 family peptidase [Nocardioides sp. 1609]
MLLRSAAALLVVTPAVALGVVLAPSAPAYADPGSDCREINTSDTTSTAATDPSLPMERLRIAEAQELATSISGRAPGEGVGIAVLDSGVADVQREGTSVIPRIAPTAPRTSRLAEHARTDAVESYHGTAMASVINGREDADSGLVGIAPAARVYDLQVYDTDGDDDDLKQLTLEGVVAGLEDIVGLVGPGPDQVQVVNLSLSVPEDTDALDRAVRAVTDRGAIVVASSGNRPTEDDPGNPLGAYEPGEDNADDVWPAGYAKGDRNPRVIAVGTTTDAELEDPSDPRGVLSSAIDVAVPTYGAVAYAVNGNTCSLSGSSTSVAAAEVSGVLALLMSAYPDDTPEQTIARLESTATGGSPRGDAAPDKVLGRGIVQPVNALTSPIRPSRDGALPASGTREQAVPPAPLPVPQPDVLAGTRRDAVWWGLVGGGTLVVAMLLRPVLSRRRR